MASKRKITVALFYSIILAFVILFIERHFINKSKASISLKLLDKYLNDDNHIINDNFVSTGRDKATKKPDEYQTNQKTKLGPVWTENGVIFRPNPRFYDHVSNNSHERFRTPELSSYEPYVPFNEATFFNGPPIRNIKQSEKKIMLWYQKSRYVEGTMDDLTPLTFCPEFPCLMTTNRSYLEMSSMLIINGQRLKEPFPPSRAFKDQVFVFHNIEPSHRRYIWTGTLQNKLWQPVYNWTMTYRVDSTIQTFFGAIRKHPNPPRKDYKDILSKKTGFAAMLMSNCGAPSGRDTYIAELRKYIRVDIYGKCGNHSCGRDQDKTCVENISASYKFYFAFENALCEDMLSEKFFRFMTQGIVTVLRGDAKPKAPKGIYINTMDFESPLKLASYLAYLDKNDEEYTKILKQKDQYVYLMEPYSTFDTDGSIKYVHFYYEHVPFCEACQKLWNLDQNRQQIANITKWFFEKECLTPKHPEIK